MTTRTGPLRDSSTRGLAIALLLVAGLIALALGTLVAGSRPADVPPAAPTAGPSTAAVAQSSASVTPSPSSPTPSSPPRTFATPVWTLTYLDSLSWLVETSDRDMGFHHVSVPVTIGVGTLEAAVRPTSIYVTRPDLDLSVKTTVAGYLEWLQKHPKLVVTDPVDITVAGRPAKQVDVTLKPSENYAQGSVPSRLGIAWFGGETAAVGPTNGETHRLSLLAFGERTVIVDVSSTEPASTFPIADDMLRTFSLAEGS